MSRPIAPHSDSAQPERSFLRDLPSLRFAFGALLVAGALVPAITEAAQNPQSKPFDAAAAAQFRQGLPQSLQPLVVDLRSRSFLPSRTVTPTFVNDKAELYVQFARGLSPEEQGRFIRAGVRFFDYVGASTYSVRVKRTAFDLLRGSPLVRGFENVHPEDKITEDIHKGEIRANAINSDGSYQMRAYFYADVRLPEALHVLDSLGILVPDRSRFLFNQKLEVAVAPHKVMSLAASEKLRFLTLIPPPYKDDNVTAAQLSNIDDLQLAPYNLTGTGVVFGQWESGNPLTTHSDLTGRVTVIDAGSTTDHGTHVAGTILGDGTGNAAATGMSTGATLFSWTFGNFDDEHFSGAINQGLDITNNSWGANLGWDSGVQNGNQGDFGNYDGDAFDIDQVIEIRRLVVCKSAGNDGNDCNPNPPFDCDGTNGGDGQYDTLPTWAVAKNVITVGAVNDDGTIAAFSSRGPANDGRVKPDIVANGVSLTSSWAGGVTDNSCGMGANYCSISGTSMSGPTVAGAIGLLFERYRQVYFGIDPGPEIVKAILVNTATDSGRPGPDYTFGHGQLDALAAAQVIDAGPVRIVTEGVATGEIDTWLIAVPAGTPELRTTLCWTDYEGATNSASPDIVNQLDLQLISPTNQVFYPFSLDPANVTNNATATGPNAVDNVEHGRIANPAQGFWRARVIGTSVPAGSPQDYALVANLPFQLGTQPNITVNAALDYDEMCEGEFQDKVVQIFNTGGADLLVHSVTVTSGAADFVIQPNPIQPFLVHAGSHVDVTVRFDPTGAAGVNYAGSIQIFSSDPDQAFYNLALTGSSCPPPDIAISGSTDFGNVCTGDLAEKVLNICNVGGDDLNVTSVAFNACDDFTIINNIFPATVLPGHCLPLTVRYTPTEAGPHTCTMVIASNDPDENPLNLAWTGTTPGASLDVQDVPAFDPTVLVTLGDCEMRAPLNITNNGACPIYIKDVMITPPGAHFTDFVLLNRPAVPIMLAPGEALGDGILQVAFRPHQVERAIIGTLKVKYQSDSPMIGDETEIVRTFCGEGVNTGARLVVKHNGVPVPLVDRVTLWKVESLGPPLSLTSIESVVNKPLITVPATPPCPGFSFHREWGGITNPVTLAPGDYLIEVRVTLNGQQNIWKLNFSVNTCDFLPDLVINVF